MIKFEAARSAVGRAQPGDRLSRIRGAFGERSPDDAGRKIREISLGEAMMLGQQLACFGFGPAQRIEIRRKMTVAPNRFRKPGGAGGLENIDVRSSRRHGSSR